MDNKKEIEQIKNRLDVLEKKFSQANFLLFSYIQAVLGLMSEHGMIEPEEFQKYLATHKKSLARKIKNAEFFKNLERQFKPKEK